MNNISSKSQTRQGLIVYILVQYNTQAPWRTTSTIKTNEYHHHCLRGYQYCVWPCSDPFFWQNSCSGCKSGIDLFVALKYFLSTLLQRRKNFCYVDKIQKELCKAPSCHSYEPHKLYTIFAWCALCCSKWSHSFFAAVCVQW